MIKLYDNVKVAGTAYHATAQDLENLEVGNSLQAVADPKNEYDSHAVSLWKNGLKFGYLPKSHNQLPAYLLSTNVPLKVTIVDIEPKNFMILVSVFRGMSV